GSRPLLFGSGSNRDMGVRTLPFLLVLTTRYFIPGAGWHDGARPGLMAGFTALVALSALASALACFVLARRRAFSRAGSVGWALCGLLFGWVGMLLLLALQERPAHIACPNCGKARVVTRDACERCGAAHAAPAPDGTEIFERADTIAPAPQPRMPVM